MTDNYPASDYKEPGATWQTAIQAALAAAEAGGGGTVTAPAGTVIDCVKMGTVPTDMFSSTQQHSHCLLIGSRVTLDLNGSTLRLSDGQNASLVSTRNMLLAGPASQRIGVVNGVLDINCQGQTAPPQGTVDGITLVNVDGLTLDELTYLNARYSSFKLLGVRRFRIDRQATYYSDGDAYRLGSVATHGGDQTCRDGHIGYLYAEGCSINRNGTLQGNPIVAALRDVTIDAIHAIDCGGGYKLQDGTENLQIGLVRFAGAAVKTVYNSSANSGLKIQGGEFATVRGVTIGQVIASDCGGEGLYVEGAADVSVGSYIGARNAGDGARSCVRVGNASHVHIGSVRSTAAGSAAVTIRPDAARVSMPSVSVTNCNQAAASAAVIANGSGMALGHVTVEDTRAPVKTTTAVHAQLATASGVVHSVSASPGVTPVRAAGDSVQVGAGWSVRTA